MRLYITLLILVFALSACAPGDTAGIQGFLQTIEARMGDVAIEVPVTGPEAQATDYPPPDDDDDLEIPDTPVPFDPQDPTETMEQIEPTSVVATETPDATGTPAADLTGSPSPSATPTRTRTPSPSAAVTGTPTLTQTATATVTPVSTQTITPTAEMERESFLGEPLLFSELAGYEVRNLNGQDIGGVSGVIYDSLSGQAQYAVLAPRWALGVNRGTVPVPWGAFNLVSEGFYRAQAGILLLPVEEHVLSTGPTLDRSMWDGRSPPDDWDAGIADYWVNFAPIIPVTGEDTPTGKPFLANGPLLSTGPFFRGVDIDVTSVNGSTLAEVKDFVLDEDGTINYAVVLVDDVFGIGGRLAPVPFGQMVWSPGGWFIFQGSPATLEAAPGYSRRSEFPDFTLPGWDADIRGYWAEK